MINKIKSSGFPALSITKPIFVSEINDLHILEELGNVWVLPRIYDPEGYDTISVSLTMRNESELLPHFIYKSSQRVIKFLPVSK